MHEIYVPYSTNIYDLDPLRESSYPNRIHQSGFIKYSLWKNSIQHSGFTQGFIVRKHMGLKAIRCWYWLHKHIHGLNSIRNPKSKTVLIFFFFFFFSLTKDNKHISKISIYFDTSRILFKGEMTMNYKYSITSKYNYCANISNFNTCWLHVQYMLIHVGYKHVQYML